MMPNKRREDISRQRGQLWQILLFATQLPRPWKYKEEYNLITELNWVSRETNRQLPSVYNCDSSGYYESTKEGHVHQDFEKSN